MSKTMKAFIDGLLAGIIAGCGPLAGALLEMPRDTNFDDIGGVIWLAALIFAIAGAAKGWRSYTKNPDVLS